MISKLVKDGKAQVTDKGIQAKFDNIMKEIDDKSKAFYDSVKMITFYFLGFFACWQE